MSVLSTLSQDAGVFHPTLVLRQTAPSPTDTALHNLVDASKTYWNNIRIYVYAIAGISAFILIENLILLCVCLKQRRQKKARELELVEKADYQEYKSKREQKRRLEVLSGEDSRSKGREPPQHRKYSIPENFKLSKAPSADNYKRRSLEATKPPMSLRPANSERSASYQSHKAAPDVDIFAHVGNGRVAQTDNPYNQEWDDSPEADQSMRQPPPQPSFAPEGSTVKRYP